MCGQVKQHCLEARLTLWRREVNDIAITLEHVDLLDSLNWLHVEFLQRRLQLLVIGASALVDLFDFSPRCALAAVICNRKLLYFIPCGNSEGIRLEEWKV